MALRQTARWSENRRGSGFRACIALLLLTGLVAGCIAVTATAQTYPRCITGCTAKDVTLKNVYLDYTGSGAPGEPIDADIIATLNFNRVNSYCVRIVADVYIDNVLVALNKVSQPYGFDAKGLFDLLLGPVSWPYGSVLELRNIQIFWSVDVKLSDPDSCVGCIDYGPGSKCVGYASFEVTQPLVADFEGDPLTGCAALVVQFTDLSAGGYSIDPYTYDWDFGDGTAHSTNANPLHTYENPGAYTVILTVSDSRSETDSETKTSYVVVADCSTDLRVTKIANSNPVAVGDLLTYTITAWNDGPGEASGVVVEDLIPAGTDFSSASATRGSYSAMSGTWNIGTLAVGASETLTLGVVVTSDAGPTISNTACIDGTETDPDPLNDCSTMTTNVTHAPVLQVLKTGPGSADVGDTITYSFDVSHAPGSDGSDVRSITVSDTVAGAASYVSGDDGDTLLEASETWRFEATYIVQRDDPTSLGNTGCVNGVDVDTQAIPQACDNHTTTVNHNPLLEIDKQGPASANVGDTVTYVFFVSHAPGSDGSDVSSITVSDTVAGAASYVSGDDGDTLLEASETWRFEATYIVQRDDPTSLGNTGCVNGVDVDTQAIPQACDNHTTTVNHNPLLEIDKQGPASANVGDTVTYVFFVSHAAGSDGSDVSSITVSDTVAGAASYVSGDDGDTLLEASETWRFEATYIVQRDDPTSLGNTGCVNGVDVDTQAIPQACDNHTTTVNHNPLLEIDKQGPASANVGDTVTYVFFVSHAAGSDGSDVSSITVSDTVAGAASYVSGDDGDTLLEASETWRFEATYIVQRDDPTSLGNTGCVNGVDIETQAIPQACDTHTTTVNHNPLLEIDKQGPASANVGDTVTYVFFVSHAAGSDGSDVSSITVSDTVAGAASYVSGDDGDTLLEASETWRFEATYIVQRDDPTSLGNTGCVNGVDVDTQAIPQACDNHTTTVNHNPLLEIDKQGPASANIGDTVTYVFFVSHAAGSDGSDVRSITVSDTVAGAASYVSGDDGDTLLEASETWRFEATYIVQRDDPTSLGNTGCVNGVDVDTQAIPQACDNHTTTVNHNPLLEIDKQGPASANIGDTVTYVFFVSHAAGSDGSDVRSITVSDTVAGAASYVSGDDGDTLLEASETWRFEATYIVQRDDPTSLGNTGCVNGVDVDTQAIPQACDNHTTTVNHNPLLEIDKQGPASANIGDTVTYVFFVSHAAGSDGSDVSSITVSDTVAGAASYVSGDDGDTLLEASETWRFEATYIVQRDDPTSLGNTGCVNGVDVDTQAIPQACDTHTTTVNHNPLLKIVKAGPGSATVGQTVTYTFAVSHDAGSDGSPVDSLSISDDVAGSASLVSKTGGDQDSFLELGEVWNYSSDYTIQPTDADPLENVGCVSGQDLDNQIVSDCDTHTTDLTPQIRVSDVSVTEGDTATFTVTLSNPSASTITVDYLTSDGTAEQPGDYTLSSGTVTFLPGETSREVPVPTIEDLIDEDDETFDLSLSGASNATIADPLGVGTILDDDGAPSISMNDVNVNEGDTASFTVRLSNPSASTITVDYLTSDGTASQPGDYTLSSGTVTFLPGETSKPITVPTVEDLIDEADETFDVNLSNAANAAIADPLGVGTILDDDGSPSISIDDVDVDEGDTATFTVSLSNPSASTVTVDYVTSDGTAEQPGDYTLSSGTVTFLPGETSKPITVPTVEDLIDETDETFNLNLSNASNASITDPLGVGTILDDDGTPSIVIDDVSVNEGDTATFTVTLSNPSASTITVDYGTSDGTAGQPDDYTLSSGTVTFLPGETSKSITVPTIEDLIDEADETFNLNLSNASNANIGDPLGAGTILDDDGSPTISIDDVTVNEGDTATFTVALSNPSASTVTVNYVTSDGTAEQPGDYTLSSGTVTFLPGETSKPITVPTIEDLIDETDETFNLNLSNASNASITDPLGVGTILDDDDAPTISIDDVSINEGDTATFTVTLSNPSASTITVDYLTSDGTAEQPGDYSLSSGTVTFLPGETSKPITVPTVEDLIDEPDETFDVNLSNVSNASIVDPLGVGTILDDDDEPSISMDDVSVNEGDTATFSVTLSNPSASTVTVNYATSNGTAEQPGDYTLSSGTVTFLPGETSKPITVPTNEDLIDETDETFNLNLSNASNASISDPLGVGTILDDDGAPSIVIDDVSVNEGDTVTFTVSLSNPSSSPITVDYATNDGTAEQPGDYTLSSGTVTFLPGETSKPITVPTIEDPIDEPNETFDVNLSGAANANITDPLGVGTILDDDDEPTISIDDVNVNEGDTATFTVSLSNPSASTVTVDYLTSDGTAEQPGDYSRSSGTVTFLPGETSKSMTVPTVEDLIDESDEAFDLNLSNASNANIGDPLGVGTILDDDDAPTISIDDVTVNEGDTGAFTVSLSNPSAATVTVNYVTSDGSAAQPGDYTLSSGTVTFLPGETSKPVSVYTIEDLIDEPNETFDLNLSNAASASIADPLGEGMILDDDDAPTISIDDVSVAEGDTATFTVSLSNPSASPVTVDYVTSDGNAEQPGDYSLSSGTVTFLPGETSKPITVPTIEDLIDEPDETFDLNLSNASNANIGDPLGVGTILDDDGTPAIVIDDVSVNEGDTATFTVSLSNPSASPVTVNYVTSDGSAAQPGDYTLSSGTVTFLPGETSKPITVPTIEDLIDEPDETFDLNLSNASNANIGDPLGEGTIFDDDDAPSISIDDVSVAEGDTATFTVSLTNSSASTVTVNYATSNGTAEQPGDYTLSSGTVTFLPGETSKPITVPTIEDLIDEPDETFDLNLSNASNANIGDPLGLGTILDDDDAPSISIDDVNVNEGDTATFTVSLSNPSASTITVDYLTSDGIAEQPGDYTLSSGTVTFLPGETSKPITVPTIEDPIDEADETFDLNLSNAANATIADPLGEGTILDDDDAPTILIDDVNVNEGDTATFTVTLSNPSASTITIDYLTSDGTAEQPGDYSLSSGTVTFLPGETSKPITVLTIEDLIDEPDETFDLNLSNAANATIADPLGEGTILDDDGAPSIVIDDVSVAEGDTATFTVTLSNPSASTITVDYLTSDGTAGQPDDYTLSSGTVTFLPGETSKPITVPTIEDLIDEPNETFDLNLLNASNASITDPLGVGTILDDDDAPTISIDDVSVAEGDTATFTVGLTNPSASTVTVDYLTSDGTAEQPGDYTLSSGTVTFLPGETSKPITVPTIEDLIDEPDETFDLNLSNASNANIGDPLGEGTILDDDNAPSISINDVNVNEGDTATFTVSLSNPSASTITVDYLTSDGTAGQPGDYTLSSGTVTFLPGETSKPITVPTIEDLIDEPDETFDVNLANASNATIADSLGEGTIVDDDGTPSIVTDDVSVNEGDTASFTVTLSNPSASTVTVDYLTSDGTASQPGDYTLSSGTATFLPGETSKPVTVPTIEDLIDEPNETFGLNLSNVANATIADPLGEGTILDDDDAPSISIDDVSVTEGDTATFTVTLSNPSASTVTVDYGTSDGTASQPGDYTLSSGTVTFLPGETSKPVTVPTIEDLIDEPDETFAVNLSNASNATIADLLGEGTIVDDDAAPTISVDDVTVDEGDTATFTVSLSSPSAFAVTVDYGTSDGTAAQPGDYSLSSGTVTFLPGETSKPVTVPTIDDLLVENDESFDLNLSNASNANIGDPLGVGSILDNDEAPRLTITKDGPGPVQLEDTILYTITVQNTGTVDLHNVTLDDPLLGLSESLGTLVVGEIVTFTPTFGPVTEDDLPGPITNVATADSDETDPVSDNHLVSIITDPIIDLSLTNTVDNSTPSIGDVVVFTITLSNTDAFDTATGVEVTDKLPDGYAYVDSDPEIGFYNPSTGVWAVGVLPAGVSVTLEITATVLEIDDYENVAEVSDADQEDTDSTPGNAPTTSEDDDDASVVTPDGGGHGGGEECIGKVIISEVAWAGSAADPTHEWIELRNIGSAPVDLTGWTLQWSKKQPVTAQDYERVVLIHLSGTLGGADAGFSACEIALQDPEPPIEFEKRTTDDISWYVISTPQMQYGGYYTLERLSDRTIANIDADKIYDDLTEPSMELWDDGAMIQLLNANGDIVDTANAFETPQDGWPAGDVVTHASMERTNPLEPDEPGNWHTNIGVSTYGTDADGRPLVATADALNSGSLEEWTLFVDLDPSVTLAGSHLEVGLDLSQAERRESGWPWIRVTRPVAPDIVGGGASANEPSTYAFSSRYAVDLYWLAVDTAALTPGDHLVWIVFGEGEAVLVPITITVLP